MGTVYLIPAVLAPDGLEAIPFYIIDNLKKCKVIFAENERTARRYLKSLDKEIIIDDFEWHTIHKAEEEQIKIFAECLREDKNVAIISEAGCPGIADPGQILVEEAQKLNATIRPLTGPSSILLALMASGLNGQSFEFVGYLPIDNTARSTMIQKLESDSRKNNSTKIFIETPYRNLQLLEALGKTCASQTKLCVAVNLTANDEFIRTADIAYWKNNVPHIHKIPAIFLLYAGSR